MATPQLPQPALSPLYTPATEDTQILIRMVGNTSRVSGFGYKGELDPFQMWAAARWLQREADRMQAASEAAEAARQAKNRIATPSDQAFGPTPGLPRG